MLTSNSYGNSCDSLNHERDILVDYSRDPHNRDKLRSSIDKFFTSIDNCVNAIKFSHFYNPYYYDIHTHTAMQGLASAAGLGTKTLQGLNNILKDKYQFEIKQLCISITHDTNKQKKIEDFLINKLSGGKDLNALDTTPEEDEKACNKIDKIFRKLHDGKYLSAVQKQQKHEYVSSDQYKISQAKKNCNDLFHDMIRSENTFYKELACILNSSSELPSLIKSIESLISTLNGKDLFSDASKKQRKELVSNLSLLKNFLVKANNLINSNKQFFEQDGNSLKTVSFIKSEKLTFPAVKLECFLEENWINWMPDNAKQPTKNIEDYFYKIIHSFNELEDKRKKYQNDKAGLSKLENPNGFVSPATQPIFPPTQTNEAKKIPSPACNTLSQGSVKQVERRVEQNNTQLTPSNPPAPKENKQQLRTPTYKNIKNDEAQGSFTPPNRLNNDKNYHQEPKQPIQQEKFKFFSGFVPILLFIPQRIWGGITRIAHWFSYIFRK